MRYRITQPATIPAGVLGLTEQQAAARAYALKSIGHGLYEVLQPVQFKRGEQIDIDESAAKALLKLVEQSSEQPKPAPPPKKA
jgi:hypothetical protein